MFIWAMFICARFICVRFICARLLWAPRTIARSARRREMQASCCVAHSGQVSKDPGIFIGSFMRKVHASQEERRRHCCATAGDQRAATASGSPGAHGPGTTGRPGGLSGCCYSRTLMAENVESLTCAPKAWQLSGFLKATGQYRFQTPSD
jgi:hypothetical protein